MLLNHEWAKHCLQSFLYAYPSEISWASPSARKLIDNTATTVGVTTAGGGSSQLHSRGDSQPSRENDGQALQLSLSAVQSPLIFRTKAATREIT